MSLLVDSTLPEWTDTYIFEHPKVRFMAVANDGRWVKTKGQKKYSISVGDVKVLLLIKRLVQMVLVMILYFMSPATIVLQQNFPLK